MNIVKDLRCTADGTLPPAAHYEVSVFYDTEDGPPECPTCGGMRVPFWATAEMTTQARSAAVHTFKPFEVDGGVRITSEEGALRYRQYLAATKGVPVDSIQFNSRGNVQQTTDELRHRAITKRRENGFDERTFSDYRSERNRISAEESSRGGVRGASNHPSVGYRSPRG